MEVILKQVSKSYKDVIALNKINLTIPQGVFGILGPSGSGKTTLMKILMALLPPDSGEVIVDGIPINNQSKIRAYVSYLPEDFSFYPSMSIFESMDYMARLEGINSFTNRKERINELLLKVNLIDHKKEEVKDLSEGMKRRLGIAISLLKNPKVLLLDEPTEGLNEEERVWFRTLISEVSKDRIVVLSTHSVEEVEDICKNIGIINKGEILFCGRIEKLIDEAVGKVRMIKGGYDELSEVQSKYCVISMNKSDSEHMIKIITEENVGEKVKPNMKESYLVKIHNQTISEGYNKYI